MISLILIILHLLRIFEGATVDIKSIPNDLIYEIFDCTNDLELGNLRLVSTVIKDKVNGYFESRQPDPDGFGAIRAWQLSRLMGNRAVGYFTLKYLLYHGRSSKNHIKLLKFIKHHPEFRKLYVELREDRHEFILPMMKYYSNKIHEYDDFMDIMGLEMENVKVKEEDDCSFYGIEDSIDFGIFVMLMNMAKLLQS